MSLHSVPVIGTLVNRTFVIGTKFSPRPLSGHPLTGHLLTGQNMFSPDNGDLVLPQSSLSRQKAVFVRIMRSTINEESK